MISENQSLVLIYLFQTLFHILTVNPRGCNACTFRTLTFMKSKTYNGRFVFSYIVKVSFVNLQL